LGSYRRCSSIRPAKEAADYAAAIAHCQPVKHHRTLDTTEVTAANAAALYKLYDFSQTAASQ
jgi:hypothetical protein